MRPRGRDTLSQRRSGLMVAGSTTISPALVAVPMGWELRIVGELVERVDEIRGELEPEPTVLSCSKDRGLIPQIELFQRRLASTDTCRYKLVSPGDFVYDPNLLWSGALARSRQHTVGIVSPVYEVFKTVRECSQDFLFAWLMSPSRLSSYRAISMGTNVRRRRAAFGDFAKLPILLPPLAEQRAIAAVLGSFDEAIERTEAVIAATERLRDVLLHELLTRGVPGWHLEWKEAPGIGTVPACWEVVRLGDVCGPPEYGAGAPARSFDPNLPRYVRITDLTNDGRLRSDDVRSAEPSRVQGYELEPGDLLFARSGATVGKTYMYRPDDGPCVYAGYLIRFRPVPSVVLPKFLGLWTHAEAYRQWVASMFRAGAQPNINAMEYSSMRIPLPTLPEQRAIAAVVDSIDEATERAREERDALQRSKASVSDGLLTGRVRVKGGEIEMESKREENQRDELRTRPIDEQTALEIKVRASVEAARTDLNDLPEQDRDSFQEYIEYLEDQVEVKRAIYQKGRASAELDQHSVLWDRVTVEDADSLKELLERDPDEHSMHRFLKDNPQFLVQALTGGHGRYQISKPRLGAEFVPDFLIAEESSIGLEWYAIEIESPRVEAHTTNGLQSHHLTHAIGQIRDWREWVMNNLDYARRPREQDGLGLIGIDNRVAGLILIGRRNEHPKRYNQFRRQMIDRERIVIHSYDWLVDLAYTNRSGRLSRDLR